MLDNPEKTTKLLAAFKGAVPFEVELTDQLVKHLRAHAVADKKHHTVANLSYAGDEGGIVCQPPHPIRSNNSGMSGDISSLRRRSSTHRLAHRRLVPL
jgi:hypothetical protein